MAGFNARTRGARHNPVGRRAHLRLFQLARPRGARHAELSAYLPEEAFQLARPRGARPLTLQPEGDITLGFNSRAREGRDCLIHDR